MEESTGGGGAEQAKAAGTSPGTSKFLGKVVDLLIFSFFVFAQTGLTMFVGQ